jgi:predicted ATPase
VIARLLEGLPERGAALVVRGHAGIGKSALLAQASSLATDRGMLVMSATGVQSEANLPFAGLHQLLRPVLAHADHLPPLQRNAVMAAFGMTDAAAPELFLIALAALELLSEAAADSPVVLIVEDAQWLDRSTADALAFIGRRVESDPIILLAAIREGYKSSLAGLSELHWKDSPIAPLESCWRCTTQSSPPPCANGCSMSQRATRWRCSSYRSRFASAPGTRKHRCLHPCR